MFPSSKVLYGHLDLKFDTWTLLEGTSHVEIPETMRILLRGDQHTLECREVHCNAPLNGGSCICNVVSALRGSVGELISDIIYNSNLGNLTIEAMNALFFS